MRKFMKTKFFVLIFLLAATAARAQTNNLSALLQQGLLEEQANGNLDAAIVDYRSLAAEFDKNRPLAATAVFRLGECYRAQGKTNEAAAQYQRILREFPDQETLVTMSRQNLAGLGVTASDTATPGKTGFEDNLEDQEIQRIRQMVQNSPDLISRPGDKGLTPLFTAASKGQLRVAEFLLANGAEVNWKSPNGYTALGIAALCGQNAMVKLLLDHNADIDAGGVTPLFDAAHQGYKVVAETLLAHHANVNAQDDKGNSPLEGAAASGNVAIVELLAAHGANVNFKDNEGRTPLSRAAGVAQNDAVVKALLDAKADPNAGDLDLPLLCAIHIQDALSAEMLLQAGANPNTKGNVDWEERFYNVLHPNGAPVTPLFLALSTGQFPLVQLLLKFKADPNDSQSDGRPVLFEALPATNILEALLDAGAKVDALETIKLFNDQTDKRTALDAAAAGQNEADAVGILLKHGANPNAQDDLGDAALHWAALFQLADEKVFSLLLEHKANPNARDNNGKTPLDLVKEKLPQWSGQYAQNKLNALVDLLHQHGALDNLPHWDRIEVTTASTQLPATVFQRGTNDWNRFTLLEAIFNYYVRGFQHRYPGQPEMIRSRDRPMPGMPGMISIQSLPANTMPFPDLTRIVIVRPSHDSTNSTRITVNLLNSTNGVDCAKDVPLEFGDIVEIPERDHSLGDQPVGLTTSQSHDIEDYLKGTAQLVVRDQKQELPLDPVGYASTIARVLYQPAAQQLILSSSDLSRVKVTRHDPKTGEAHEWILDCSNSSSEPDLWIRNGDLIEVPEKP